MPDSSPLSSRKGDHIRINLDRDVQSGITSGLDAYQFISRALPEIDLEDVNTGLTVLKKTLKAPILISSMTGGNSEAEKVNRNLATAAQHCGVAMGVGSMRAALEEPDLVSTFLVRKEVPDILLFANLGAVQLNYGYTVEHCRRVVEILGADALFLHLNALQEAVQPGGNTRFSGLLKKIEEVCRNLEVPVFIKEVGWGISAEDAARLKSAGVSGIDVAGAGGTSWSQVEMYRIGDPHQAKVAGAFRTWGIPTAESIRMVKKAVPDMMVFASGGLRDGVDIARCIALGAILGGMASPFLKAAVVSAEETVRFIQDIQREIQICMFACGIDNLPSLRGNTSIFLPGGWE
ncbi:MAG: type 2 isopentenyl-diphosphate Delta-isomerase [Leptolinea sp.]|jgi:isopentenyl-diphosphate delta-isomerase|nr:type 2 isopentenyl-diphosphate Delta-isomerase [Leptolinea sp.]